MPVFRDACPSSRSTLAPGRATRTLIPCPIRFLHLQTVGNGITKHWALYFILSFLWKVHIGWMKLTWCWLRFDLCALSEDIILMNMLYAFAKRCIFYILTFQAWVAYRLPTWVCCPRTCVLPMTRFFSPLSAETSLPGLLTKGNCVRQICPGQCQQLFLGKQWEAWKQVVSPGSHETEFPAVICRILETAVDSGECLTCNQNTVALSASPAAQKLDDSEKGPKLL